jgi:hypothetical protein
VPGRDCGSASPRDDPSLAAPRLFAYSGYKISRNFLKRRTPDDPLHAIVKPRTSGGGGNNQFGRAHPKHTYGTWQGQPEGEKRARDIKVDDSGDQ